MRPVVCQLSGISGRGRCGRSLAVDPDRYESTGSSHLRPWSRVTTLVRMIASVRSAKARFSELLERAAAGEEIVIAAAGRPKAKLVGLGKGASLPFRVNRALLRGRAGKGTRAERLVRAERDARD